MRILLTVFLKCVINNNRKEGTFIKKPNLKSFVNKKACLLYGYSRQGLAVSSLSYVRKEAVKSNLSGFFVF